VSDPFNLERFVVVQDLVYAQAIDELRAGAKHSHWMWFVFPQIEGLGRSETARKYAISSREEAEAYLHHPTLGPRLRECTRLVCLVEARSAHEIFGAPDDLKFHSSMTLFANVAPDDIFSEALAKYFGGEADPATLDRLRTRRP
jgi:uncharacterized protein (DUF1810 family)